MIRFLVLAILAIPSATAMAQLLPPRGQTVEGRYRTVSVVADLPNLTGLVDNEKVIVRKHNTSQNLGSVEPLVLIYSAFFGGTVDNIFIFDAPGSGPERFLKFDQTKIDVMQAGAVGNGLIDDTAVLQACINLANTTGLPIQMPLGTFIVSKTVNPWCLQLKSSVKIRGVGIGKTVIKLADGSTNNNSRVFSNSAAIANTTLEGITIDGNKANYTGSVLDEQNHGLFTVPGSTGITLRECEFKNCKGDGVYVQGSKVLVTECQFRGNYRIGLHFSKSSEIVVSNNIIDDSDIAMKVELDPGDVNQVMKNIQVVNNNIRAFSGIVLNEAGQSGSEFRNLTISGNVIEHSAHLSASADYFQTPGSGGDRGKGQVGLSIFISGVKNGTISNNQISNSSDYGAIQVCRDNVGVAVTGNTIKKQSQAVLVSPSFYGAIVLGNVALAGFNRDVLISDNVLEDVQGGIHVDTPAGGTNTARLTIDGNVIRNLNQNYHAIDIHNGSEIAIRNNSIDTGQTTTVMRFRSTLIEPSDIEITDNVLRGAGTLGLLWFEGENGNATNVRLIGNKNMSSSRPWIFGTNPGGVFYADQNQPNSIDAIRYGTGDPNSVISAPVGTLFRRTNGGTGTTVYIKESGTGNTGWNPVSSGSGSGYRIVQLSTDLSSVSNPVEGETALVLRHNSAQSVGDVEPFEVKYLSTSGATIDNVFVFDAPGASAERFVKLDKTKIDVMQAGAVGNGINDDSQEIVAAMNAMSALGGGKVVFPRKTFEHNFQSITVPSNITVEGNGAIIENAWWAVTGNDTIIRDLTFRRTGDTLISSADYHGIQPLSGNGNRLFNLRFEYTGPTVSGAAIRITGATHAILDGIYFGNNAGAMGVANYGTDIQILNLESDNGQNDDGIAIKSVGPGLNSKRWKLNNITIRGGASGVSIGSEIADSIEDISVTNLTCDNCASVVFVKAGYDATPTQYLGGTIKNVVIDGFVYHTNDPAIDHGATHLFWFSARRASKIRNVVISNGVVDARRKNPEPVGSDVIRVDMYPATQGDPVIEKVTIDNVVINDSLDGATSPHKAVSVGTELATFTASGDTAGGTASFKDFTMRDVAIAHLGGSALINLNQPWVQNAAIDGLTLINPSSDPLSGDTTPSLLTDTLGSVSRISRLRILNTSADNRYPGPSFANRADVATSPVSTPPWLEMREFDLGSNTGPFTKRFRLSQAVAIQRFQIIDAAGIPVSTTNWNRYEIRRRRSGAEVIMAWFETRNTGTNMNHDLSTAETPRDNAFGLCIPYDELFFDRNGEQCLLNSTDEIVVQRTDTGTGQTDTCLRLRVLYVGVN
jgi:polygalacturonase